MVTWGAKCRAILKVTQNETGGVAPTAIPAVTRAVAPTMTLAVTRRTTSSMTCGMTRGAICRANYRVLCGAAAWGLSLCLSCGAVANGGRNLRGSPKLPGIGYLPLSLHASHYFSMLSRRLERNASMVRSRKDSTRRTCLSRGSCCKSPTSSVFST